jgi:cell fate (sporulation/competence/biofilm development) regulator YlbF (YheA/YmcA/DUF963 family)
MNELLFEKLDELRNVIDNHDQVKELLELKKQIYQDDTLKEQLEKYRNSPNKYDTSFINLKSDIINNPLIKRYRELENELYFMILEINGKLNSLVDKKGCSSESH